MILYTAFYLLAANALFAAVFLWQSKTPEVYNGARLEEADALCYSLLMPERQGEGRYFFSINCDRDVAGSVSLVLFRAKNFSLYNNADFKKTYLQTSADNYKRIRVVALGDAFYDPSTQSLSFYWEADQWFLDYSMYLANTAAITRLLSAYGVFQNIVFGMLALMIVYSLSLFLMKRDERYLLQFSGYIAFCLVNMYMNHMDLNDMFLQGRGMTYSLSPFFFVLQFCVSLSACFGIIGLEKRGVFRRCFSGCGIIIICTLYGVSRNLLPLKYVYDAIPILILLLSAGILIYACSLGKKGSFILLAAISFKSGLNFMHFLVNIGLAGESVEFIMFRSAMLPELPFAFACMFCINRRFADKFKESERLAAQLAETNRSLDQKVEERTRQYIEQREKRHNMMLNIFHDLRSPLFTLKGCTDIMAAQFPQERELTEVMQQRLSFVSNLTEDLFKLAKLEDEDMLLDYKAVSLTKLLQAVCRGAEVQAAKKRIELTADIRCKCSVWGNRDYLECAFQNLVTNAIFFTPDGGRVELSLRLLEAENMAAVRVADTGKGIKPQDMENLFTKYYRIDPRGEKASTGLGLSIAKNVVERHKGRLEVESEYGSGAAFTVYLPLL